MYTLKNARVAFSKMSENVSECSSLMAVVFDDAENQINFLSKKDQSLIECIYSAHANNNIGEIQSIKYDLDRMHKCSYLIRKTENKNKSAPFDDGFFELNCLVDLVVPAKSMIKSEILNDGKICVIYFDLDGGCH